MGASTGKGMSVCLDRAPGLTRSRLEPNRLKLGQRYDAYSSISRMLLIGVSFNVRSVNRARSYKQAYMGRTWLVSFLRRRDDPASYRRSLNEREICVKGRKLWVVKLVYRHNPYDSDLFIVTNANSYIMRVSGFALFFLRNYRSGIERMLEHLSREESDEEGDNDNEIIES